MKYKSLYLLVLISLVMMISCTSSARENLYIGGEEIEYLNYLKGEISERDSSSILNVFNEIKGNAYIGISGPYSNIYNAKVAAVDNLVKNILLNRKITVLSYFELENISYLEFSGRLKNSDFGFYDDSEYKEVYSQIEKDIHYILGKPEEGIGAIYFGNNLCENLFISQELDANGNPVWITDPPVIEGWRVAVGKTDEWYWFQDSIEAATFDAAIKLGKMKSDIVYANSYKFSHVSNTSRKFNKQVTQNLMSYLDGFYVLALWHDEENRKFYSLAMVRDK